MFNQIENTIINFNFKKSKILYSNYGLYLYNIRQSINGSSENERHVRICEVLPTLVYILKAVKIESEAFFSL